MSGKPVLQSGTYVPDHSRTVTVWPRPDKDGDGPEVYEDKYDDANNYLGRDLVRDRDGNPVREYVPPEGFQLIPTRDPGSDQSRGAVVRVDNRGNPVRNPKTGEAVNLLPGAALIEYADGTHEILRDDFSQILFQRGHKLVGGSEPSAPADQGGGYRT